MYYSFGDYVSVASQREKAQKEIIKLRRKGFNPSPVDGFKGKIAKSFWGKSWCDNLESYADELYRLDRGKRYIRAGCICHLETNQGKVMAYVSGTRLYKVEVEILPMRQELWQELSAKCSKDIASLLDLMKGKLSDEVMKIVSKRETGLFPTPDEISFHCSCPDSAIMCKHVAATLYGIGRRLDENPELLFQLRRVNPNEFVRMEFSAPVLENDAALDVNQLGNIFDIEIDLEGNAVNNGADASAQATPKNSRKAIPGMEEPAIPSQKPAEQKAHAHMEGDIRPPFNPAKPTASDVIALRKMSGLSQSAMAKELKVSRTTIARWEKDSPLLMHFDSIEKLLKFQKKVIHRIKARKKAAKLQ